MATYYIDFEGGNDASAGTSFATRWQTITSGATAARIAPGDDIRVMASPDPTSMGSATWTGGGRPAATNIVSSTNATPIVITANSHGLVADDYVVVTAHTTNTNANGVWRVGTVTTNTFQILQMDGTNTTGNGVGGATGNITKANNLVVKNSAALIQNIALFGGLGDKPAWTQSANVAATQNTTNWKEGNSSAQIAIAAGFTTGKAAYYTLPASLNLSSYQQVSFWIRQNSGTIGAAGAVYVALCTDTIGDTVAHTCDVPLLNGLNAWHPVTVNLATNLNAAILSVAFYVVTDNGAQTFQLDNIIACKDAASNDSVSLQSLVSKSDGTGDEAWYAIQSINSDVIMLANSNVQTPVSTNVRGYNGSSATVTSYKRETVKVTAQSNVNDSGTSGNLITYSGGWNRTDMSTQTGRTWLDGISGSFGGFSPNGRSFVSVDKLDLCRFSAALGISSTGQVSISSLYVTATTNEAVNVFGNNAGIIITDLWSNNNGTNVRLRGIGGVVTTIKNAGNASANGLLFDDSSQYWNISSIITGNCGSNNIFFNGASFITIETATITNSPAAAAIGASSCYSCSINGGSSTGNLRGVTGGEAGQLFLNNFTINETTEAVMGNSSILYSNRNDDTDNNSWIYQVVGTVNQQTAVIDSPATTAWKMSPTTTNAVSSSPLLLRIGTVVCAASSAVTVTARMRRDNTGLTMRLVCPGGQILGVTNSVFTDMTAAADTWETVTITFTPTKPGAVDIYAYAFGGTTFSGYVSNLTASQV